MTKDKEPVEAAPPRIPVHDPRREPIKFANYGMVQLQDSVALLTLGSVTAAAEHREGAVADVEVEIVGRFAIPPAQLAELANVMLQVAATANSMLGSEPDGAASPTAGP